MKTVLITHSDGDAVGCAAVILACYPDAEIYFSDRHDIINKPSSTTLAKQVLDRVAAGEEINLYIADIDVSHEIAEEINQTLLSPGLFDVHMFDHHPDKNNLDSFDWVTIDHENEKCGAMLLWEHLYNESVENGFTAWQQKLDAIKYHIVVIDDFDRYVHQTGLSYKYTYLNDIYGNMAFAHRLCTGDPITHQELIIANCVEEVKNNYLKNTEPILVTQGAVYAYAERFKSELGHYLAEKYNKDVAVIINMRSKGMSFRNQDSSDISCTLIANELGGGGHPRASGAPLNGHSVEYIINTVETFLRKNALVKFLEG